MPEETMKMVDQEHCLICNDYIGKGHDPAVCLSARCNALYSHEAAFNRMANNQEDMPPEFKKTVDKHFWRLV